MERNTTLCTSPEISAEQWEQIRQTFIEKGRRTMRLNIERKLTEGYYSECFYPAPEHDSRKYGHITFSVKEDYERRATVKVSEFWNSMCELYGIENATAEGKWLINTTLETVDAKRGKNCGGMSPDTFWNIYMNFCDIFARMTKTGEYDPEDDDDASW